MTSNLLPFFTQITRTAKESIYNISDMRRRVLSSATGRNEQEVKLDTKGVSILLVQTKIQSFNDKVLRIKKDEVRLPKDLFAGKWSDTLKSGSVQVFEEKHYTASQKNAKY